MKFTCLVSILFVTSLLNAGSHCFTITLTSSQMKKPKIVNSLSPVFRNMNDYFLLPDISELSGVKDEYKVSNSLKWVSNKDLDHLGIKELKKLSKSKDCDIKSGVLFHVSDISETKLSFKNLYIEMNTFWIDFYTDGTKSRFLNRILIKNVLRAYHKFKDNSCFTIEYLSDKGKIIVTSLCAFTIEDGRLWMEDIMKMKGCNERNNINVNYVEERKKLLKDLEYEVKIIDDNENEPSENQQNVAKSSQVWKNDANINRIIPKVWSHEEFRNEMRSLANQNNLYSNRSKPKPINILKKNILLEKTSKKLGKSSQKSSQIESKHVKQKEISTLYKPLEIVDKINENNKESTKTDVNTVEQASLHKQDPNKGRYIEPDVVGLTYRKAQIKQKITDKSLRKNLSEGVDEIEQIAIEEIPLNKISRISDTKLLGINKKKSDSLSRVEGASERRMNLNPSKNFTSNKLAKRITPKQEKLTYRKVIYYMTPESLANHYDDANKVQAEEVSKETDVKTKPLQKEEKEESLNVKYKTVKTSQTSSETSKLKRNNSKMRNETNLLKINLSSITAPKKTQKVAVTNHFTSNAISDNIIKSIEDETAKKVLEMVRKDLSQTIQEKVRKAFRVERKQFHEDEINLLKNELVEAEKNELIKFEAEARKLESEILAKIPKQITTVVIPIKKHKIDRKANITISSKQAVSTKNNYTDVKMGSGDLKTLRRIEIKQNKTTVETYNKSLKKNYSNTTLGSNKIQPIKVENNTKRKVQAKVAVQSSHNTANNHTAKLTDTPLIPVKEWTGNITLVGKLIDARTGFIKDKEEIKEFEITLRSKINKSILLTHPQIHNDRFIFNVPSGKYSILIHKSGFINYLSDISVDNIEKAGVKHMSFVVNNQLDDDSFRAVLTWGKMPRDLDFIMFKNNEMINFRHKRNKDNTVNFDLGVAKGEGPEIFSFKEDLQATFKLRVKNFSNEVPISESNAKIRLYKGVQLVHEFSIPKEGKGRVWRVFNIERNQLTIINSISNKMN